MPPLNENSFFISPWLLIVGAILLVAFLAFVVVWSVRAILLVEDEPIISLLEQNILQRYGFRLSEVVVTGHHGERFPWPGGWLP